MSARINRRHSAETRAKMSASRTGKVQSAETRAKIAAAITGVVFSQERREKIRLKALGRRLSAETRAKLSVASRQRVGPLAARWKGGVTRTNTALRNDESVRIWREAIFARDNHTCRRCSSRGGYLHAHHILPFAGFPQFRTDIWNGSTLCVPCHKQVHDEAREEARKR